MKEIIGMLKTARINTGLLAFSFAMSTISALQAGSLLALLGAFVTGITVAETFKIHKQIGKLQGEA